MNYLTKYRIEFASIAGVQWKIDIQEDAFEGSITNLTATGNPLKIAFDSDADTFNDPVKSSKAVFNVYSLTDFQLVDLYSNYDFRFRVLIYKDDTLYWQGFIITGEYSEPYNCPPYPVQITAIDGLSHLKNILYVQSQTISIGTETLVYYEGRKSESQILFNILSKIQITGFREYVNIFEHQMPAQTIDDSPFDQVIIDVDVFRDFYCWDVLVEIVKKYNAIIRQANGEIIIYRPIELTQSVVYGRIFTAFDTKTSTSFVPDQYINRAAIPSGLKQFPGSVKMVKRPVRKITINQDYGYKKSFLDNWEMKGNTLSGSGVVWNLQSWGKTNTFLIQPATICGEPDGVVLVDHNEYPTLNKYLFQSFGTYLKATYDIHFFEFDYMIWNGKGSAGADIVFYVELSADDASNYLIGDGTDSTQWQASIGRMDITYPSPIQSDGWHTFKRSVPGLPVDGPYSVSLYATDHAEPLIFVAFKNIRFYATSDSIVIKRPKYKTLLLKIIAFGQRPKSYQVVKDNAEIVQKEYILENRYNNIPINGIELLEEYLLGDVVDSNVENVVEQFQGALAVGIPDSYTGAIDKVDTATFHPTAGSGTVSCNGYSESIVWNTSVSQTLDDFMAAHSGDFGTVVLVKTSGSTITFTGSFDFVSASISASFGTAVNTTPYYIGDAIYTLSPTEQWNSLNPGLEARPLLEIIAGETAFQYSRPKELIQMMIHDNKIFVVYNGFGLLYNQFVITANGGSGTGSIAPIGWHVATDTEYHTLVTTVGVNPDVKLKDTNLLYWLSYVGTNNFGFNGRGNGFRSGSDGTYQQIKLYGWFHSDDNYITYGTAGFSLTYNYASHFVISNVTNIKRAGMGIRCVKDDSTDPGSVTDFDGNIIPTVKIGSQVWMAQNMRVTRFNNGILIPEVITDVTWIGLSTPARCWYNNIPE